MRPASPLSCALLLAALLSSLVPFPSQAVSHARPALPGLQPVVRAVLFWSDTCGHCHYVLEEVLPPLQERYGESLEILLLELATAEDVDRLYQSAAALGIPQEEVAVPFLVIGDRALIGSKQIPEEFPSLIEAYLAQGSVDYPDLLPLAPVLPGSDPEAFAGCLPSTPCETQPAGLTSAPGPSQETSTGSTAPAARSNGFTLAIAILVGMLAALAYSVFVFMRSTEPSLSLRNWALFEWAVPMLALAGMGVAGYLAYVETQAVSAICGPVGDCNAVQSSPYARLFGVLPVGVMGLAGYLGILLAWVWWRLRPAGLARRAPAAVFAMALFGTLFSVYLTYLEPFVIRAVCIWCLTSAVLITLLLLVSVRPAAESMERLDSLEE